MKYYMIEIPYQTNSGEYSYRKIFTSEEEMNEFFQEWLKANYLTVDDLFDMKEISDPEWSSCGPNWDTIHEYKSEDGDYIIMMVIDNDKEG